MAAQVLTQDMQESNAVDGPLHHIQDHKMSHSNNVNSTMINAIC